MDEEKTNLNEEPKQKVLQMISDFHGHLGPFVVIGYRIGEIGNRELGEDPFGKKVSVHTGTTPPISCIIDGIQLSSGCTLGKGNLTVEDEGEPIAVFSAENKKLRVSLKEEIQDKIEETSEEDMESLSRELFSTDLSNLFSLMYV